MIKKTTDLVVQPTPMKKGDRAQHVLTGERVIIVRHVTGIPGSVGAYVVTGKTGPLFRATEMELIRLPKGK